MKNLISILDLVLIRLECSPCTGKHENKQFIKQKHDEETQNLNIENLLI